MGTAVLALRVLTALVFATAGASKLGRAQASRGTLKEFGLSERLAPLGVLLGPVELAVAASLMFAASARSAALAALAMLAAFTTAMARALRAGRHPDCGCFGAVRPSPISRFSLVRNGLLGLASLTVVTLGPGPGLTAWVQSHALGEAILLALAVVSGALGLMFGLRGRAQGAAAPAGTGIPLATRVGEQAPEFSLADPEGRIWSLAALRATGLPVVLVFASATCGSCLGMFGDLARWQRTLAGSLRLVLIGSGDSRELSTACRRFAIAEVLLDEGAAAAWLFGAGATPSAVAVAPSGAIESGPVIGPDAIEDLLRFTLERSDPVPGPWHPATRAA